MSVHDDSFAEGDSVSAGGSIEPAYSPETRPDPGLLAAPTRRGLFVTFEGIEGSGKTTQITRLAEKLAAGGEPVLVTREPGGSVLGRRLRSILLEDANSGIERVAEMLLYVADRAQHLHDVVQPALAAGTHVLCDRFLDATLAYQGHARGIDLAYIREIHRRAPLDLRPDRTILLDLDPEIGLDRARRRNDDLGLAQAEGRFEREGLDFHRRVREGYLALAEEDPFRFRIVAAEGGPAAVETRVADLLADLFPCLDTDDVP